MAGETVIWGFFCANRTAPKKRHKTEIENILRQFINPQKNGPGSENPGPYLTRYLELRPGVPSFSKRQGADPNAGCSVDRIDDRRRRRWKRRLTQAGWGVVGFEELHLNRRGSDLP